MFKEFFFFSPFSLCLPGRSFLVANAAADTHHIIFCSDGFCKMTGYTRAEVMQRSACTEFLHGPMTAQSAVAAVKEALIKGLEKHFEILYYRKTGEFRFLNPAWHICTVSLRVSLMVRCECYSWEYAKRVN